MRIGAVVPFVVLVASAATAQTFTSTLQGGREVGGGGDPAGQGLAVVTFDGTAVRYFLWVKGIAAPSAAHIHPGVAGQSGTALVDLAPTFTSPAVGIYEAVGAVTADAATIQGILQRPSAFYVNVHNAAFPEGAVRGQLLGDGPSGIAYASTLTGLREPTGGDPSGAGFAAALVDGTTLYYYLFVRGITSPTAAEIRSGARGQSGPVVIPFNPTFANGAAFGAATTDATTLAAIAAQPESFYFNVPDAAFPNGAVRGQLGPTETDIVFPVVARNPGLGTSFFRTDFRILSLTDDQATVYAEWYPKGGAGASGPAAVATVSIVPNGEAVLDDAVNLLFGASDRGAVRLLSTSPLLAITHNFNDQRSAGSGTFGLSYDGLTAATALTSGALVFNSHRPKSDGSDFRTNIGYFNPNPAPVQVTFNVRTPDGSLVGSPATVTLAPWANDQGAFYQTIPGIPAAQQTLANFYVTFTSTKPVFIFSTVVDNRTDDALQEEAIPVPAALTQGPAAPPSATITNPSGNPTVATGQAVSFVGTGSDPAGLGLTAHWDFGDGVSADGFSVTHTFSTAGTYTVAFTVTNTQGLSSGADQRTVTVTPASSATLSSVQAQIFTPICSACHPPNQGMDLRTGKAYASVVNVPSAEQPALMRVKPGDPDNSYLYQKVLGAAGISGARMPFGGPALSAAQIQLIHDWIVAGAPNN